MRAEKPIDKIVNTTPPVKESPPKKLEVKITAAKGRPMLTWVGKRPLSYVTAFPAQHVETFDPTGSFSGKPATPDLWNDWPAAYPKGGLLFHGDNKEVLTHLLANGFRGKVNLIYIDPPFDSGADYVRKVSLRGAKGTAKLDGESYTLGEQIQYTDIWANDNYLQFMYERLLLLKELLTENGSLFLHCDWKRTHLLRCLLDEIFGSELFRNEIVRVKCNPKNAERKAYGNIHDCVLYYVKSDSDKRAWNRQREPVESEDLDRLFEKVDSKGRRYTTVHSMPEAKDAGKQACRGRVFTLPLEDTGLISMPNWISLMKRDKSNGQTVTILGSYDTPIRRKETWFKTSGP